MYVLLSVQLLSGEVFYPRFSAELINRAAHRWLDLDLSITFDRHHMLDSISFDQEY